eukprot:m.84867 g.84867  ORF g.84867 m.84867 type:complete len:431 (+) comp25818_c1_seq1:221-1513(+)
MESMLFDTNTTTISPTETPKASPLTFLGAIIAVAASVFVNIGLNVQKYAHTKAARKRTDIEEQGGAAPSSGSAFTTCTWWLGIAIQLSGETGNAIAYMFAPTSIIAPLGAIGLLANLVISSCFLGERFRLLDLFGVLACTGGAVVIAIFSPPEPTITNYKDLWHTYIATSQTLVFYAATMLIGFSVYILRRHTSSLRGKVWVPLCILVSFMVFTLGTIKSVMFIISSASKTSSSSAFLNPLFPTLIPVLGLSGFGQIYWLNQALQEYDASLIVPANYVVFSLAAIAVGEIVFHEFETMQSPEPEIFGSGVALCMFGVILISTNRDVRVAHDDTDADYLITNETDNDSGTTVSSSVPMDPTQPSLNSTKAAHGHRAASLSENVPLLINPNAPTGASLRRRFSIPHALSFTSVAPRVPRRESNPHLSASLFG